MKNLIGALHCVTPDSSERNVAPRRRCSATIDDLPACVEPGIKNGATIQHDCTRMNSFERPKAVYDGFIDGLQHSQNEIGGIGGLENFSAVDSQSVTTVNSIHAQVHVSRCSGSEQCLLEAEEGCSARGRYGPRGRDPRTGWIGYEQTRSMMP